MQKIIALIFVLFITSGSYASAHSAILSSIPEDGSMTVSKIDSIKINFNTKIEKVMQLAAKNEAGKTFEPGTMSLDDKTLIATFKPPLENGAYTLETTVIGSDGHKIETKLSFTVNVPSVKNDNASEKNSTAASAADNPSSQSEGNNASTESGPSWWMIAAIAAIVVILIFNAKRFIKGVK